MLQELFRSRKLQALTLLFVGVVYSIIGTASHTYLGHTNPIAATAYPQFDLPAKTLLGQTLSVSFFPGFGIDATANLDHGISDWNSHLRNNNPMAVTFDVLTRIGNSDNSADILVKVFDPAAGDVCQWAPAAACVLTPVVDDAFAGGAQGQMWINRTNFPGSNRDWVITHELGHAFAGLSDHYERDGSVHCYWPSVMGDGSGGCPLDVVAHDNQDVRDIFSQELVLPLCDDFLRAGGNNYKVRWEACAALPAMRQHGETNFIIDRASTVFGPYSLYSFSSRNSMVQDGISCCTGGFPENVALTNGDEWCVKLRTENLVWPMTRAEHYGKQTVPNCIARSPDGRRIITLEWNLNQTIHLRFYNDGSTTISNIGAVYGGGGGIACSAQAPTLPPSEWTWCEFDQPCGTSWYVDIWYNNAAQDTLGFATSNC
jgi:hypothetical protein